MAVELEGRWNGALAQVAELESRLQELRREAAPLSDEQKRRLLEMGKDLRRLWEEPQAPVELKKRIVRTVVKEIVVNSVEEQAEHRLQWGSAYRIESGEKQNGDASAHG